VARKCQSRGLVNPEEAGEKELNNRGHRAVFLPGIVEYVRGKRVNPMRRIVRWKQVFWLLVFAGVLILFNLWIFQPHSLGYFDNLWHLLGRPDRGTRVLYLIPVALFIFVTSARVFRHGPL